MSVNSICRGRIFKILFYAFRIPKSIRPWVFRKMIIFNYVWRKLSNNLPPVCPNINKLPDSSNRNEFSNCFLILFNTLFYVILYYIYIIKVFLYFQKIMIDKLFYKLYFTK